MFFTLAALSSFSSFCQLVRCESCPSVSQSAPDAAMLPKEIRMAIGKIGIRFLDCPFFSARRSASQALKRINRLQRLVYIGPNPKSTFGAQGAGLSLRRQIVRVSIALRLSASQFFQP